MYGIISTANSGVETFQKILALKMEMDREILDFGKKAHNAGKLIEFLYQKPIVSVSEVIKILEVSKQATKEIRIMRLNDIWRFIVKVRGLNFTMDEL